MERERLWAVAVAWRVGGLLDMFSGRVVSMASSSGESMVVVVGGEGVVCRYSVCFDGMGF